MFLSVRSQSLRRAFFHNQSSLREFNDNVTGTQLYEADDLHLSSRGSHEDSHRRELSQSAHCEAGGAEMTSEERDMTIIATIRNEHRDEGNSNRCTPTLRKTVTATTLRLAPSSVNDRYRIEIGLTRLTPSIVNPLKAHYDTLPSHSSFHFTRKAQELDSMFATTTSLDFDRVTYLLLEFLANRLKVPGSRIATEMPSTWNMGDPNQVFDALRAINANTLDAKIHRAFAQMRLYELVEPKSADKTLKATGKYIAGPIIELEDIARKHAGEVSEVERDRIIKSYRAEYSAGKKWLDMTNWFGGSGIVLVFVCAEIGTSYVAHNWTEFQHNWTEFQRNCMHHLSRYLPSIKELVEALGRNALDQYCPYRHLDKVVVEKIEGVVGCLAFDADGEQRHG